MIDSNKKRPKNELERAVVVVLLVAVLTTTSAHRPIIDAYQ